jgi:hypothetical protein
MTTELYIAVGAMFTIYLLLVVTGVNNIRHARLLGLGWDGYIMSGIWIWWAISGSLGLILSLNKIVHFGLPTFVIYASGHEEPYPGVLTRQWAVIGVWVCICVGLVIRSWVMLRNARNFDEETKRQVAEMHSKMVSLERISNQMAEERRQNDRVTNETWQEFRMVMQELRLHSQRQDDEAAI